MEDQERNSFIDVEKELSGDSLTPGEKSMMTEAKKEREEKQVEKEVPPVKEEESVSKESETTKTEEEKKVETSEKKPDEKKEEEKEAETIKAGGQEFPSVEKLIDSFGETKSLMGRQANELGDKRSEAEQLKAENAQLKMQLQSKDVTLQDKEIPPPEFDPTDPESVQQNVQAWANKVFDQREKQSQRKAMNQKVNDFYDNMVVTFRKDHPDMPIEQVKMLAQFCDARGIAQISDGYELLMSKANVQAAKSEAAKDVTKKIEESAKTPESMSNMGGKSGQDEVDYDSMSETEWANLPQNVRDKALQDVPAGL